MTKPTRKDKTLIDHISSNIPNKTIYSDVIYTDEISDHDTSYAIFNIKKERYEPRYKDKENTNIKNYISDFRQLPLSIVYGLDDSNDQLSVFNKLISDCIEQHAPLKRVKLIRPIAPWMKDPDISKHKQK